EPGKPGEREVVYTVTRVNGVETARERGAETVLTEATPAVVRVGTKAKPEAPQSSRGRTWDAIAQGESGGNWSTNTGRGFSGGLQFHPQTWIGHGGRQYAPSAHLATREQQSAIAEKVQASRGWGAWPACTSRRGLRGASSTRAPGRTGAGSPSVSAVKPSCSARRRSAHSPGSWASSPPRP